VESRVDDVPAVVIVPKSDGGFIDHVARVEGFADFVERSPLPTEIDVGEIALFADADDFDEFPLGARNRK
jgi:hypothetical protein